MYAATQSGWNRNQTAIAGIGVRSGLGFAGTIVLRQGYGRSSSFPGAESNQIRIQEPISKEIFAVLQEIDD